ncbi:9528_t:CDS:2 [Rhizophagus irregularis]|uniref:Uncharacterized protein n=1 Tax=Rhizophagus irregularis (strain DAOM 181602 / DAOM 197198 / MUCL 43194) TaxID=747089 RepID=U9SZA2_RHIID|nr:9528_t:CDS:2 [Rhizophagus irregularis]
MKDWQQEVQKYNFLLGVYRIVNLRQRMAEWTLEWIAQVNESLAIRRSKSVEKILARSLWKPTIALIALIAHFQIDVRW